MIGFKILLFADVFVVSISFLFKKIFNGKKLFPVRLIKNEFFQRVHEAEMSGASTLELLKILGKGRAKKGMFEGDLKEGELEIGQVSSMINEIKHVSEIMKDLISGYNDAKNAINTDPKFQF